jgi:rRNA small subunit pseudouridine methyltransferase Nep1
MKPVYNSIFHPFLISSPQESSPSSIIMEFGQKSVRLPKTPQDREKWKRLVVILEHCPLETVRTEKRGFELLSERHKNVHKQRGSDPADYRPDVVHQCLLHLLDSPLNRAGMLEIFIHTKKGVLLSVDPRLRLPRSIRLFDKMMTQALFKLKVRSTSGYLSLMKVIKNPVTDHLPPNTRFIRVEKDGDLVSPTEFARTLYPPETSRAAVEQLPPVCAFVIGGMSRGDVSVDYAKKELVPSIRIADRGLSGAATCSAIVRGFEDLWLADDYMECREN